MTQTVTSRIPRDRSELVMMTSLLLPGTSIVYYGDEIGMADGPPIKCQDTKVSNKLIIINKPSMQNL